MGELHNQRRDDAPIVALLLDDLGLTATELSYLTKVPVEDIETWAAGLEEPPPVFLEFTKFISPSFGAAILLLRLPDRRPYLTNGATQVHVNYRSAGLVNSAGPVPLAPVCRQTMMTIH